MTTIIVTANQLTFNGKTYRCAFGKGGFSSDKKEGDGATPLGVFALRECWYRADRLDAPQTQLPLRIIQENDGWCDDPKSPEYNRHIKLLLPLAGGGGRRVSIQEENGGGMAQGVGGKAFTTRRKEAVQNANSLRKNPTDAEKHLWKSLRQKNLGQYKFRRQQAVGNYIVDFVCMDKKLVVELDGGQHNEDAHRRYDEKRTAYLEAAGYRVLRFWNNEVLQHIDSVAESLLAELTRDTPHLTSPRKREEGYSYERLFRTDPVYDLIIPLGYNDDPVTPVKGSAIFMHIARDNYEPTEGCIALAKADLLELLPQLSPQSRIEIRQ